MGWLGWTEQQTLDTTIPAIELAMAGRLEMLKTCFGGTTTSTAEAGPVKPMSAANVMSIFRSAAKPK